jgi:D-alanyl-D-alanine carboxypeptidase (penicillin-binding protein 5/6)
VRRLLAALMAAVVASTAAPLMGPDAADAQVSGSGPSSSTTTTLPPPAKAELLVDLDTGRILLAQNDRAQLPPASLSKLITALIATNWPDAGHPVGISATAANVYPDKVGMQPGQIWPFPVVLRALLIDSANDAAYALALQIGRTLARFGPLMASAAAQMGMNDHPVFHDPAGLDGTEGVAGGHTMSAWDVAIAARAVLANPTLRTIVAMRTYTFKGPDGIVYELTNKNHYFLDTYPGAIGLKTGFTDPAGLCIAAAATRNGRTLLAVVLNGASTYQTAEDLLNQGFAIPAALEPKSAPLLPPVRQPEPPPRPAPTTTTVAANPRDPPRLAAGSRAGPTGSSLRITPLDGVDIAVIVVAGGLIVLQVRRRRRRPVGAHSRSRSS